MPCPAPSVDSQRYSPLCSLNLEQSINASNAADPPFRLNRSHKHFSESLNILKWYNGFQDDCFKYISHYAVESLWSPVCEYMMATPSTLLGPNSHRPRNALSASLTCPGCQHGSMPTNLMTTSIQSSLGPMLNLAKL